MSNDKYVILSSRHRGFKRAFRARVQRGDTLDDLQFWVRTHYGVRISRETMRTWRTRCMNDAA